MFSIYLLVLYNEHINRSQQCYNLFKFDKVGVGVSVVTVPA